MHFMTEIWPVIIFDWVNLQQSAQGTRHFQRFSTIAIANVKLILQKNILMKWERDCLFIYLYLDYELKLQQSLIQN